jgi:hypothetical protein
VIQAFSEDGKYLIKLPFVPNVITVATEEMEKVCSNVQPIKSSCMVPPDTAPELDATTVEAHQLLMDKFVCFAMSDFGGTLHAAMGSCSAPSPQISADRTLLLQIGPFVQHSSES